MEWGLVTTRTVSVVHPLTGAMLVASLAIPFALHTDVIP